MKRINYSFHDCMVFSQDKNSPSVSMSKHNGDHFRFFSSFIGNVISPSSKKFKRYSPEYTYSPSIYVWTRWRPPEFNFFSSTNHVVIPFCLLILLFNPYISALCIIRIFILFTNISQLRVVKKYVLELASWVFFRLWSGKQHLVIELSPN